MTQQEVIQKFMKALDQANVDVKKSILATTLKNNVKKAVDNALDEAFQSASNNRFNSMQELINSFLNDCAIANDEKDFLRNYCGIILDNEDIGVPSLRFLYPG